MFRSPLWIWTPTSTGCVIKRKRYIEQVHAFAGIPQHRIGECEIEYFFYVCSETICQSKVFHFGKLKVHVKWAAETIQYQNNHIQWNKICMDSLSTTIGKVIYINICILWSQRYTLWQNRLLSTMSTNTGSVSKSIHKNWILKTDVMVEYCPHFNQICKH